MNLTTWQFLDAEFRAKAVNTVIVSNNEGNAIKHMIAASNPFYDAGMLVWHPHVYDMALPLSYQFERLIILKSVEGVPGVHNWVQDEVMKNMVTGHSTVWEP